MHTLTVVQVYCRHNSSSPPVQGGDGEWSVGRVLKRDTLSNNTVYQDMLREGRRKGLPVAGRRIIAELEQEIQHLQEKVQQLQEDERLTQQHQLETEETMGHTRDVQISQLENDPVQNKLFCSDGTLKASHLELKAASNEKQSVDTVDTGVQADYLAVAPGYLRGVEVYGETVLEVVGDKPQKLEWPGYGFYMEIPDGALDPGVTASVGVKVTFSGQFKLPENSQLISAIYWISSSKVFRKEVAINIQHFAVITSEEQCSKFRFVIAKCSQKELPYTFREREGSFNPHTQYGAIKLKQFSGIGQTGPNDTEFLLTNLKLYKPILGTLKVDFVFVVVYNHEPFLKWIREQWYHNYLEDQQCQGLVFDSDKDMLVLDLPAEPKVVDGWKILPMTHPKIDKLNIQKFQLGRNPPACTIELEWTESGEQKSLLHKVNIIGAKKPDDYFYMWYYPQAVDKSTADSSSKEAHEEIATGGQIRGIGESDQQTLKISDLRDVLHQLSNLTPSNYSMLGLELGLLAPTLNQLESTHSSMDLGRHIMEAWLNQVDNVKCPTWECLIAALQSPIVKQNVTAQQLRQWLISR